MALATVFTLQQVYDKQLSGEWPTQVDTPTYTLWTWGKNDVGQLGLGDTINRSSPTQVGSSTWKAVSDSIAIRYDNSLWSWGYNAFGRLGLGDLVDRSTPVQIGTSTDWAQVRAHYGFGGGPSTAIKTDGTLWTWGKNDSGQLGLGDTINRSSPTQVGSLTNWSRVFVTRNSGVLAIKTNGTLWAWGNNYFGVLGLGNSTTYSSPVQVGALTDWINIDGLRNAASVKANGTLWVWGRGLGGANGQGNELDQNSPKQVGTLTNWASATAGAQGAAFGIKTDGTLWSWGKNYSGNLGLSNTTDYSSPKQVGSLTNWSRIVSGRFNTYALKTDGTFWVWGANYTGMLGLGNTTQYNSPKQLGSATNWAKLSDGAFGGDSGAALRNV